MADTAAVAEGLGLVSMRTQRSSARGLKPRATLEKAENYRISRLPIRWISHPQRPVSP